MPTTSTGRDARAFLAALLVDIVKDKNFRHRFKAGHRQVHQFFWSLQQDERSRCFVEDLLFDTNGNFPHSEQIDELLQEFQLAGVLSRPNPTYRYNDITIKHSSMEKTFKDGLSGEQKAAYESIVTKFKDELGERSDT